MSPTTMLSIAAAAAGAVLIAVAVPCGAAAQTEGDLPAWLAPHVGNGPGQISAVVLDRARALHARKAAEGAVSTPCYMAMDATRPNDPGDGGSGGRFYVICEAQQSFSAIPAGHGSGRNLGAAANFSNGRRCARNFGNAQDSELTTGGGYVTGEIRTSFKGYYRTGSGPVAFSRAFIPFEGEGETANARAREIGGHAAVTLKNLCLRKAPDDPHANADGYVVFGNLVDYAGGRSNGCTSWSSSDAADVGALTRDNPTTLYIYPEATDIRAAGRGGYWNASCLGEIGAPHYWSRAALEPVIARFKREHPAPPPRPLPLCTGP